MKRNYKSKTLVSKNNLNNSFEDSLENIVNEIKAITESSTWLVVCLQSID